MKPSSEHPSANYQLLAGLARIATVLKHETQATAGPEGLSPTQAQILTYLVARSGERKRVGDTAMELAITSATASDAVRVLEEKGLLRKESDPLDRRAMTLNLTAKGKRLALRLSQWPDFLLAAVDALSQTEQAVFRVALIKMVRELQQEGRIPTARMCSHCLYFRPHVYAESQQPHHCDFVDAPFGNAELRLDCSDFEAADTHRQHAVWQEFLRFGSVPQTTMSQTPMADSQFVQIQQKEKKP
ncbi:MAG: MarR family winged helix-turn-helix transcriptional regulator [Bryobacterales bacterium]|jgi:DNA-binding MarR family transcriptional regulator|nr:MarR family winged helix-turn-helix transcriptional regulator [Bryobacterales bacterium]